MELGISGWMAIIGALLFLAVMLDGYRRMQRDRRHRVKMPRRAEKSQFSSEHEAHFGDLPNGGNRRLKDDEIDVHEDDKYDPLFNNPFNVQDKSLESESFSAQDEILEPEIELATVVTEALADEPDEGQEALDPVLILIVHVLAKPEEVIQGDELKAILTACDCHLNKQGIFQRHEQGGEVQFNVVNSFKPGFFEQDLTGFETQGVSFFMSLPGPHEPLQAYNAMVEVARCVAKNLRASLQDEQRSSMTEQTLEHGRQRIRDYLQQQLTEHVDY